MSPDAPREVPEYASTRLIAYLGNKRALLPQLAALFGELEAEGPIQRFIDPFAGSGAVARLARSRRWLVECNDIEEYSRAVNSAWLGVSADELPLLFPELGGLDAALERLNVLHPQRGDAQPPCEVEPYIAAHYAPADTAHADWRRERLFYTRENAVFLDRARCAIEHLRPRAEGRDRIYEAERDLLIGLVVYEAATHANTSGVFKAYHKGFGGHGADALGRILAPMLLERPLLWPGRPSMVLKLAAADFCSGRSADLCYLDPPYNQHQYGSNYHLLNTIAAWDRPPVDDSRSSDGCLLRAAGIPPGWKESRSAFCSRKLASEAFKELAASIDARTIVLSYNSEGLVAPEELLDIFSQGSSVELRRIDYVKYRGGRQSAARRARNSEILLIARRSGSSSRGARKGEKGELEDSLSSLRAGMRLAKALEGPFDPAALKALCDAQGNLVVAEGGLGRITLPTYRCLVLESGCAQACARLGRREAEALASILEPLLLADNAAACEAAAGLIEEGAREMRMQRLALGYLRKLAHRRYASSFRLLDARLKSDCALDPSALAVLASGLDKIESLFEARMDGLERYAGARG